MAVEVLSPQASSAFNTHDRSANLNFWVDLKDGSVPAPLYLTPTTVTLNRELHPFKVQVTDVTGKENQFTLDNNAFEFRRYKSNFQPEDFSDPEKIKTIYYKECEKLLCDLTGGNRALVFDHRVRNSKGAGYTGPVSRAHVDHSANGAASFLRHYMPDEAEDILKSGRRWIMLNAWRPIKTIERDPLTVADGTTFDSEKDFHKAAVIYKWGEGESMAVIHNSAQKWYYKYHLSPEEVVLIKHFDSDASKPGQRCPHSAIVDEDVSLPDRESSEVRAFVFY
jgi:hypothetical protein